MHGLSRIREPNSQGSILLITETSVHRFFFLSRSSNEPFLSEIYPHTHAHAHARRDTHTHVGAIM